MWTTQGFADVMCPRAALSPTFGPDLVGRSGLGTKLLLHYIDCQDLDDITVLQRLRADRQP